MNPVIDIERFRNEGYLLVRGLISPKEKIEPLMAAYEVLFEAMFIALSRETKSKATPSIYKSWRTLLIDQRFAALLGVGGHIVMDHLDPSLNNYLYSYRFRDDLPAAWFKELFEINTDQNILSVVSQLIGDEISLLLNHHYQFKLSSEAQRLARIVRREVGTLHEDEADICWKMHIGNAPWTTGAMAGFPNAIDSGVISAWIPLVEISKRNGRLKLIKGSHRLLNRRIPNRDELTQVVNIDARPGDVVFIHNKLFQCFEATKSEVEFSWNINCRYIKTGDPVPRPHLPSFVIKTSSQSECFLNNESMWRELIKAALLRHNGRTKAIAFDKIDENKSNKLWEQYRLYHSNPLLWQSPVDNRESAFQSMLARLMSPLRRLNG